MLKDKIEGMFLGIAIGDTLGAVVENKSKEYIAEKYPNGIKDYQEGRNKNYTDDTQLTLSVANALIEKKGFDLDVMAKHHVSAFKESIAGWGGTTREAIAKIINGVSPKESGNIIDKENPRGYGNGTVMKCAPMGIYYQYGKDSVSIKAKNIIDFCVMTHNKHITVQSTAVHVFLISYLLSKKTKINKDDFVSNAIKLGSVFSDNDPDGDDLCNRLKSLKKFNKNEISDIFGKGHCYVYDSLPFSYAYFLSSPNSIESMFDCIMGGGDTDTNASIVGGLLGALNGTKIFPPYLVEGLNKKDLILETANKMFEVFCQ